MPDGDRKRMSTPIEMAFMMAAMHIVLIRDHCLIQPALTCPDVGNVTGSLLVWTICNEVLAQQVRGDVKRMIAVGRDLVFLGPDDFDAILPHYAAQAPVSNLKTRFLQFFGRARPAIALQAEAVLFADMRQDHHIVCAVSGSSGGFATREILAT